MSFQDRPLECLDCRNEFIFSAGEQEFYERKGFHELPKRCKACRDARKAKRPGDQGGGGEARGDRPLFDAVCATCNGAARVPFRPTSGRPVYCRECYSAGQGQGSRYGGGF